MGIHTYLEKPLARGKRKIIAAKNISPDGDFSLGRSEGEVFFIIRYAFENHHREKNHDKNGEQKEGDENLYRALVFSGHTS